MKVVLLAALIIALPVRAAEEIAMPTAEAVSHWAHFSRPVVLSRRTDAPGDARKWGKLVATAQYDAPEQTVTALVLAAYERGTFSFGGKLEKIREMDGLKLPDGQRLTTIEQSPDGREILTFPGGFGPGGGLILSFTASRNGRYDLLVGVATDSEHGVAAEHRLKDPAQLQSSLRDVLTAFDDYASNAK